MNRIILIGNGFDLAHKLPTKYEDFINWYWDKWLEKLNYSQNKIEKDILCTFECKDNGVSTWMYHFHFNSVFIPKSGKDFIKYIKSNPNLYSLEFTPFMKRICMSIEAKGWVDIENEYYKSLLSIVQSENADNAAKKLNDELDYIKSLLAEYLTTVQKDITPAIVNTDIKQKIFEPFRPNDISVEGRKKFYQDFLMTNMKITYPATITILNFNYTSTADIYAEGIDNCKVNHIHGHLDNYQSIIFGYGDEFDRDYKSLLDLNDNEFLRNIKSIRYLEYDYYRKLLSYIGMGPYQIYIMGHSCGNSDRTLLNTLFEHGNCISIKPFYYKKNDNSDNYIEIVQNISRNFTNREKMRDRIVNKTYCETLPQNE